MKKLISIIVPCFNESENLKPFTAELISVLKGLESIYQYEIIFINDGSNDNTIEQLKEISDQYPEAKIIDFSRNFGKEAALTAGIDCCKGDIVIPMDADLQHPPELIPEMINKWKEGYDVVLARRSNRNTDGKILKLFSENFYKLQNLFSDVNIPKNVGDFRLMDKKVIDALKKLPERRRFMKGIFAWVGYNYAVIDFEVQQRNKGKSSFNFWKLFNFAIEGITSFSTIPLRIWTYFGFTIAFFAFLYALTIITKTIVYGRDLPGYPSLMCIILFLGGIQLISIGVLGEYVGRIYNEVKQRPLYLINEKIGFNDENG